LAVPTLVLFILVAALPRGQYALLWLMPLAGYGFAWVGPLYGFIGDWVMYKDMWTGRTRW